ncbi:MAG: hypothetical protein LBJ15_03140 [Comamonas sp.]|jgi:hypothetical protein|uniref:hypothetical protein n=1 Tax=Comamonas sp. TaxID=34028 RepID=UPI0028198181|nr:hypothetical protein [Comamonas sp.]MDR0212982.1 hypothetical protein [Comamonas sp.]
MQHFVAFNQADKNTVSVSGNVRAGFEIAEVFMQNKLWQLTVGAVVVMGLAGCSAMSSMTDKVGQTWDKTWSSFGGKGGETKSAQAPAKSELVAEPAGLKPGAQSDRWQGLYSLEGERGRFQECGTGQIVPVLAEKDSVLLEQAYLNTRSNAAAVMLAEVMGRMVEQPASDPVLAQQGRKVLALRVERFVTLSSKTVCPKP